MKFKGGIHIFGDHIDTDVIIPAKYLNQSDPKQLAMRCFEPVAENFYSRVSPGDFLFVGENFGCGSSREHAPIAIKAMGVSCIVAKSFARIFYRSAINIGLPVVTCPLAVAAAHEGGQAEANLEEGWLIVKEERYAVPAYPQEVLEIIQAGGLVNPMQQRLREQGKGVQP
jgi:3-isopropylmalate/(R)-2-methylmalate dehydratase small subunit